MGVTEKPDSDLQRLRDQLDRLDGELLRTLAARLELVAEIIRHKEQTGSDLRDTVREAELLGALVARASELGLDGHFVTRLYREIIDYSLRTQKRHLIDRRDPASADPITVGRTTVKRRRRFRRAKA